MRAIRFTSAALFALLLSIPTLAQMSHPAAAPAPTKGFRAEMLAQNASIEKKLVDLAEAMPAEKYGWRPGEGVRSVGEVYAHVAGGNYFLLSLAGVKPPADIDMKNLESTFNTKEKAIGAMKASFAFVSAEVSKMSDADLEKPVKVFGHDTTMRGVLMIVIEHGSEHLGQSIAYARMNGVTPPWSKKPE